MAKLKYDKSGRLLFTKEMKKEYKIIAPMMLPIHFKLISGAFALHGYDVELLSTSGESIVNEGLKYVHNDSCYPALLTVGQLIDAVKSGKYDTNKIALLMTQTGGGCRASNYIHLLRKAVKNAGFAHVPVVSLNFAGLEKNPGFKLGIPLIIKIIYSVLYGDLLMALFNRCHAYEINKGDTQAMLDSWEERLYNEYKSIKNLRPGKISTNFAKICDDFASIPLNITPKVRVGIVGEIYVKYAPLGNNDLEKFLHDEDCEVILGGLLDFISYTLHSQSSDIELYGGSTIRKIMVDFLLKYIDKKKMAMSAKIKKYPQLAPIAPCSFFHLRSLVNGYLSPGNKMGEGWLLTAEMLELIESGADNIVCTQPFGCLPNHIVGKGMIRPIKEQNPNANIVAIDYDPGATKVNQENRIKLMLANARDKIGEKT